LLSDTERKVFDALAVFATSFDAPAALAVAGGEGVEDWAVTDALIGLVTKSMLAAEPAGQLTRYRLLETLRQYGVEQLGRDDRLDMARRRHAAHFAAFSEKAAESLRGKDELELVRRLRLDMDNLRSAVNWAMETGVTADRASAERIVAALAPESNAGRALGLGEWAERLLAMDVDPMRRPAIEVAAALHALDAGRIERAIELAAHAEREIDWTSPLAGLPRMVLSIVAIISDDVSGAIQAAEQARDQRPPENSGRITLTNALAGMHFLRGDLAAAAAEGAQALEGAERTQNPTLVVPATFVQALCIWRQDPKRAASLFDEGIRLTRAGAVGAVLGHSLAIRAVLAAMNGERREALTFLLDALRYSSDKGDLPMLSVCFDYGIQTLGQLHEYAAAARFVGYATSPLMTSVSNMPAPERPHRAAAIDRTREAVGEEALMMPSPRRPRSTRDGRPPNALRRTSGSCWPSSRTERLRRNPEPLRSQARHAAGRREMKRPGGELGTQCRRQRRRPVVIARDGRA
jgi:hypothetical protein